MRVVRVSEENFEETITFLKSTSKIKEINNEIVYNGSFLKDDDEIVGILSYETFNKYALVRYFIFKKHVQIENIYELLDDIKDKLREKNISILLTIVSSEEIYELFESLGFVEAEKDKIFIDESMIINTKFKDSLFLKIDL